MLSMTCKAEGGAFKKRYRPGRVLLEAAIKEGYFFIVKGNKSVPLRVVKSPTWEGEEPLSWWELAKGVICNGHVDILRWMIEKGHFTIPDPEMPELISCKDNTIHYTTWYLAGASGSIPMVDYLLETYAPKSPATSLFDELDANVSVSRGAKENIRTELCQWLVEQRRFIL